MKIWHIGDTHTYHDLLKIPKDIDLVIHSGDCSIPRDPYMNEYEVKEFIVWFSKLPINNKIYVAGNHDTSIEKGLVTEDDFNSYAIHYLFNDYITIDDFKIWGSPYTPNFNNWSFNKDRAKISRIWETIPNDTDIVVTHGVPKGIMDYTYNKNRELESCGDSALKKKLLKLQPKLHCGGHIHNYKDIINAGTMKLSSYKTIFSNGSVVTDNKFGTLSSNGNILELYR